MDRRDELIACLEGEIAKRDARIVEMQERFDSSAHRTSLIGRLEIENGQLRAELAALKAQEPAFMWHKGATEDESEVVDVDCACPCCVPLYAAPVSEAKAQGVVLTDEELCSIRNQVACNEVRRDDDSRTICVKHGRALEAAVLARITAAPAAPAADAGLVEALTELVSAANSVNKSRAHEVRGLQDDEPCYWQRKEWVDWLVTLGEQGRAALSAYSAKGVL